MSSLSLSHLNRWASPSCSSSVPSQPPMSCVLRIPRSSALWTLSSPLSCSTCYTCGCSTAPANQWCQTSRPQECQGAYPPCSRGQSLGFCLPLSSRITSCCKDADRAGLGLLLCSALLVRRCSAQPHALRQLGSMGWDCLHALLIRPDSATA